MKYLLFLTLLATITLHAEPEGESGCFFNAYTNQCEDAVLRCYPERDNIEVYGTFTGTLCNFLIQQESAISFLQSELFTLGDNFLTLANSHIRLRKKYRKLKRKKKWLD